MSGTLSNKEIRRYGRQLILPEFGITGQRKLKSASALIVGCGGLGCPAAIFLCAAGIGKLGLLDNDDVEINNLHRQILHTEKNAGVPKCVSARLACESLNSHPEYIEHHLGVDSTNAVDIISHYDVVLDCTDNVATRYLLNDACVLTHKPLVSGSALKFEGQLTVYNYHDGPCYRCLYPKPPPPSAVTNCSDGGVLGPVPGIIGAMQAQEAIKILTAIGDVLTKRLFLYDGLAFTTRTVQLRSQQPDCAVCGKNPTVTELIDYTEFCGVPAHDKHNDVVILLPEERITPQQYKQVYVDNKKEHVIIDTRPAHEYQICKLSDKNSLNIPLSSLLKCNSTNFQELLQGKLSTDDFNGTNIVCICHHGNDSQLAVSYLKKIGVKAHMVDIIGGLDGWSRLVDTSCPQY